MPFPRGRRGRSPLCIGVGDAPGQYKDKWPHGSAPRSGDATSERPGDHFRGSGGSEPLGRDRAPEGRWSKARRERLRKARLFRAGLTPRVPKSVERCSSTGGRGFSVWLWSSTADFARQTAPIDVRRVPYLCHSWRCEGCREHEAHVLYARFAEAAAPLTERDSRGWLFLTLTIQRPDGATWGDCDAAYRAISRNQRRFFKRLRRMQLRLGQEPLGNEWIATIEAHASGWPHLHAAIWNPDLAAWLRDNPQRDGLLPPELAAAALDCGFGPRCTLEVARQPNAVLSYLNKLAAEADRVGGELAKLTQLPDVAPLRFRRVRSGRRFLPPRRKSEEWTGTLVVSRYSQAEGIDVSAPLRELSESHLGRQLAELEEHVQAMAYYSGAPVPPQVDAQIAPAGQATRLPGRECLRGRGS